MAFRIDTKGIPPAGGFEPIPPGKYILRIVSAMEGYAKSSGKPQVVVGFEVEEGPYRGRKILFHRVTFLGKDINGIPLKGAGIAIHFLHTIGEPYDDANTEVNPQNWIGKTLLATIECKEDFNGNMRNNIKFVDPISDLGAINVKNQTENTPMAGTVSTETQMIDESIPF